MSDVQQYASGPFCKSVCVPKDMQPEEIEREVNRDDPQLSGLRWRVSTDAAFASGEPMPCVCEADKARKHWLLEV